MHGYHYRSLPELLLSGEILPPLVPGPPLIISHIYYVSGRIIFDSQLRKKLSCFPESL